LGFFFGTGVSIEFGIPSLVQITSFLLSILVGKELGKRRKWFLTWCTESLAKVYGKDRVDLEVIVSVIVGPKDKERLQENMIDLGLFVLQMEWKCMLKIQVQ